MNLKLILFSTLLFSSYAFLVESDMEPTDKETYTAVCEFHWTKYLFEHDYIIYDLIISEFCDESYMMYQSLACNNKCREDSCGSGYTKKRCFHECMSKVSIDF